MRKWKTGKRKLKNKKVRTDKSEYEAEKLQSKTKKKITEFKDFKNQLPQVVKTTKTIIPTDYVETKKNFATLSKRTTNRHFLFYIRYFGTPSIFLQGIFLSWLTPTVTSMSNLKNSCLGRVE